MIGRALVVAWKASSQDRVGLLPRSKLSSAAK